MFIFLIIVFINIQISEHPDKSMCKRIFQAGNVEFSNNGKYDVYL